MKKVLLDLKNNQTTTTVKPIDIFKQISLNSHYIHHQLHIYNIYRCSLNIFSSYLYLHDSIYINILDSTHVLKMNVKSILNIIKNIIFKYQHQWETHIKKIEGNKNSKKISRSYFKIKEIFNDIPYLLNLKNNSHIFRMHLAEAPGGFIQFCNEFFQSDSYHTISITSNLKIIPIYNTIVKPHHKINFMKNDITNISVINHLILKYSNSYDFITGDGGVFLNNQYMFQEQKSIKLIASEIYIALNLLKNNGTFIIKFFDTFTQVSNILIYILKSHFKNVYLHKPQSSRKTNSEKYIIAVQYNKKYTHRLLESFHFLSTIILSSYEFTDITDLIIKNNFLINTPHLFTHLHRKTSIHENMIKYNSILPNRQGQHILDVLNNITH